MVDLIYRYRAFNKYGLEELINSEFYITLPNEVNDPFDSKCIFDERGTEDDFRKHHMMCLRKQKPYLTEAQMQQEVDAFIKTDQWRSPDFTRVLFRDFRKSTSRRFSELGMVCFSKKIDNILMWSHYADKHKGFCLVFDRTQLAKSCQATLDGMTYGRKKLSDLLVEDVSVGKKLLLTKAKDWAYEKEVRMIISLNSGKKVFGLRDERLLKFSLEALTGIIFGCRMPSNDKQTIKSIFLSKSYKPVFYDTINCINDYKLKIVKHLPHTEKRGQ
jgi:hypothetical protein